MAFEMQTDVRARRVAKDLKSIAAEFKVKLRLTQAQQAVAGIYGYMTWNDLIGALGTGTGQEDHELSAGALLERKRGQISALTEVGIPEALAPDILDRLQPTARTEAGLAPVALIQTHNDYHPMRLLWSLSIEFDRNPDSTYDDIGDEYVEWAKGRTLMPLDRSVLSEFERSDLETMVWCAEKIRDDTHFVVDAVAIAEEASRRDVSEETWRPEMSDGENEILYFHFGCHRFPSPFPGLGVEGCYVETLVARNPGSAPDQVEFIFVVSPDLASEETDYVMDGYTFGLTLRENIRLVRVYFSPGEGQALGECLKTTGLGDEDLDAYLDVWRPYLPPLVNAGWNCLKAWKSGKLRLHDALSVEDEADVKRRFERARTEQKKMAVAAEIAADLDTVLVRFIDRTPPSKDLYSESGSAPYPRKDSGNPDYDRDHVQSIIEDALEVVSPWGMLWHAEKAARLAAAGLRAAGLDEVDLLVADHPAARQYLRASCLRLNALWELRLNTECGPNKKEEALALADELERALPVDAVGLFPALARIYVEHGDEVRARGVAANYAGANASEAIIAWSVALIDAKFGPAERAKASLACAHALNPLATSALLQIDGSPWSWFWRGKEAAGSTAEADHIACLHGAAWRTIDGYRDLLESVDRMADGSSKHISMAEYGRRIAALDDPDGYLGDEALKRAEGTLEDALEESSEPLLKVELARQALAISPLCVRGYIMLASYANLPPDEKLLGWENGVAAGATVLGESYFKDDDSYFGDDVASRDYMRARQGLALELWERGRRADAVSQLEGLLKLNPGDVQRNLYILLPWLIQMDRDDEIEGLLKVWSDGHDTSLMQQMTMIMWTRTLIAYRRNPATASETLVAAMKCNAFVPAYLFRHRHVTFSPGYYSYGDVSEASEYARLAFAAWRSTEGAINWVDITLATLSMNPVPLGSDPSCTFFRH